MPMLWPSPFRLLNKKDQAFLWQGFHAVGGKAATLEGPEGEVMFAEFFFFFFFALLFRAVSVAYGGSQARGQKGAGLRHSHTKSVPHL